jgi:hypothetical protein
MIRGEINKQRERERHRERAAPRIAPLTRVLLLDLLPLGLCVLPVQVDVRVGSVELAGEVHLETLVGGDGDVAGTADLRVVSFRESLSVEPSRRADPPS